MAQEGLDGYQEAPKTGQDGPKTVPRGHLGVPGWVKRGPTWIPKGPIRGSIEDPEGLQEGIRIQIGPETPPGPSRDPPGTFPDPSGEPFGGQFGPSRRTHEGYIAVSRKYAFKEGSTRLRTKRACFR